MSRNDPVYADELSSVRQGNLSHMLETEMLCTLTQPNLPRCSITQMLSGKCFFHSRFQDHRLIPCCAFIDALNTCFSLDSIWVSWWIANWDAHGGYSTSKGHLIMKQMGGKAGPKGECDYEERFAPKEYAFLSYVLRSFIPAPGVHTFQVRILLF